VGANWERQIPNGAEFRTAPIPKGANPEGRKPPAAKWRAVFVVWDFTLFGIGAVWDWRRSGLAPFGILRSYAVAPFAVRR